MTVLTIKQKHESEDENIKCIRETGNQKKKKLCFIFEKS